MGWFDWLRAQPTNIEYLPEAIWLNDSAKYAGIVAAVGSACHTARPPSALVLIAHFSQTLLPLRQLAGEHAAGFPIEARLATELTKRDFTIAFGAGQRPIEVIVAERHPHEREDAVIDAAFRRSPREFRVTHHHSFDDAIFQHGGWADRARGTMEMLGLNENEPIYSNMVMRKVRRVQRQIARQAVGSIPAASGGEWMRLNLPPT